MMAMLLEGAFFVSRYHIVDGYILTRSWRSGGPGFASFPLHGR
jgi:hypothetical protein